MVINRKEILQLLNVAGGKITKLLCGKPMKTTLQNTSFGQSQGPNSKEYAGLLKFEDDMNCMP